VTPIDFGRGVPGFTKVLIDRSLYGHPGIAFGGYVAGILATALGSAAKVDFLAPAPLGEPLTLREGPDEVALLKGSQRLAVAHAHSVAAEPPRVPSWNEALAGVGEHLMTVGSDHWDCFGCGPGRAPNAGLRIFPGLTDQGNMLAAAWKPSPDFGEDGHLSAEFCWAALDCPGGLARRIAGKSGQVVTAYLAAKSVRPITIGEPHIVLGWHIGSDGRKTYVGSAVTTINGEVCMVGEALWLDRAR
jgi:hypothetical protein